MTNGPRFLSETPLYFFNRPKGMQAESVRLLIVMFKDYVLYGAKGYIDEDGNKNAHKFHELKKEDAFLVPTGIFVMWDKEEVNIEHVHAFCYLSYLAHSQKSHIVKINKNLIKDATALSKTKFQEVVQQLINHELGLVKATEKNNQVEIPWLEPSFIDNIEQLDKEVIAIREGEIEPKGGTTPIPTYFLQDSTKLGFTYTETAIITMFASALSREEPRTFDQAIQWVLDHSGEKDNCDAFQVMAAIRKAEKKNILAVIKNRDGHISITWKGVTA
ncbi:hypothetical protein [Neobacillus cucumis]|uniref:hypothetical protein n=1 Tax=Neobacillus cucumis TaxID=1740721 RepID=UPI002E1AC3EE|nr:hypothetical protein [Neobacillus cucumis]